MIGHIEHANNIPPTRSIPMTDVAPRPPDRPMSPAESLLLHSLRKMEIVSANQQPKLTPLGGGVSSDIFRVDLPGRVICVKRALLKLKVAADWQVPVERNRWEVEWMRVAGGIVPGAVPESLGGDRESRVF